jgi:hypothetical protein
MSMKTVVLIIFAISSCRGFYCPENSSIIDEELDFLKADKKFWTLTASAKTDFFFEPRPLNVPLKSSTKLVTVTTVKNSTNFITHNLRFDIFCEFDETKKTFLLLTKKRTIAENPETQLFVWFCSGAKLLEWSRNFIKITKKIFFIYSCNEHREFLTVLTSKQMMQSQIVDQSEIFLQRFNSTLYGFLSMVEPSKDCGNFESACLILGSDFVTKTNPPRKSSPSTEKVLMGIFAITATPTVIGIIYITIQRIIKRRNRARQIYRQNIEQALEIIRRDLNLNSVGLNSSNCTQSQEMNATVNQHEF